MKLRIGSRESKLAVAQATLLIEAIKRHDRSIEVELVTMKTTGDMLLTESLDKSGGKGLFTKELERALLSGEIDLCVHSLKDMPSEVDTRLPIVAFSAREIAFDALVLPEGCGDIDFSKPIGSSSARRTLQFKELYPQAKVKPVRGNVTTRLKKLDSGEFGGLILACAGLKRLGLEHRISRVFSDSEMLPSAGQGILAVQGRAGESHDYLSGFHCEEAELAALSERAFIKALDGGCSSPCAACAVPDGEYILIKGIYLDEFTGKLKKGEIRVKRQYARSAGEVLANRLKCGNEGKVTLVGAGPYDAGLITLKGLEALKNADCVLYDRLINPLLLSQAPPGCERIDVGKHCAAHKVTQEEINRLLLEKASLGKNVVRLKGGDPFLFGRGAEELVLPREHGVPFEVIPGVTSAIAAPACAGIPVTHRDYASSLHIVTGHPRQGKPLDMDYRSLVRLSGSGTLVFLMGLKNIAEISAGLIDAGLEPSFPAAIVENGSAAGQRTVAGTVEELPRMVSDNKLQSPCVIVVGRVAGLSGQFLDPVERTLQGQRIIAACHVSSQDKLERMLRDKGCEIVLYPTADVEPLYPPMPDFSLFDYLAFTSRQGVRFFFEGLREKRTDLRALGRIKIAAVGCETAKELSRYGLFADLVPENFYGEELADLILKDASDGCRVLFAGAELPGSPWLGRLEEKGVSVAHLPVYKTVTLQNEPIAMQSSDYVVFTSASTVEGFVASVGGENSRDIQAVCIGDRTAQAARAHGMRAMVSDKCTFGSMIALIEERVKNAGISKAPQA